MIMPIRFQTAAVLAAAAIMLHAPDRLGAQPRIEHPQTLELGTLYRGEVVERTVPVQNTGTDTLVIERVRSSCGCTGTMLSTSTIAPGATGTLRLTLDTRNLAGSVTKTVAISSNSAAAPTTTIQLLADVREEIVLRPTQFWFKDAEVGAESAFELVVRNAGADTLRLKGVRSTMEGLTVEVPARALPPGGETVLTARLTPAGPMPVIADAVFLLTSNPRQPEVYIPVFGNAREFRFDQSGSSQDLPPR